LSKQEPTQINDNGNMSVYAPEQMEQGGPKMAPFLYTLKFYQILTDFPNFFTVRIRRQFV